MVTRDDLPPYHDLILPTLRAVATLGGSAQARELAKQVASDHGAADEMLALTYDERDKSVLLNRISWAMSYAHLGGLLDRQRRGVYVLSIAGRDAEALEGDDDPDGGGSPGWQEVLLARLHQLTPEGFEEFVMYLLRLYRMELTRVGGSGDEGIDGIGLAQSARCSRPGWRSRRSATSRARSTAERSWRCSSATQERQEPSVPCS